ncbi:hypothetical protein F5X98DRAFT_383267 [Xylaria grammica]|nr:hypothetical protein F5X98DRAFT_383267 [Xylaria grammica]
MTKFGSQVDTGFILVSGDLLRWVNDLGSLNDCLASLSFPTIHFRRNDITQAYHETCLWLFDQKEYCTWLNRIDLNDHNTLLWIKGKPGAGKSTLMKHALKQAEERFPHDIVIGFFFNARGGDDLEKTPLGFFRSVLHQLFWKVPSLRREFLPIYTKKRDTQNGQLKWHPQELQECMSTAIKSLQNRRILFFVDALDECEEESARELIQYFEVVDAAARSAGSLLNICVSSRHYPNIHVEKFQELNVDHQNYRDILTYVRVKLRGTLSDEDISTLGNEVAAKSSGVFLWVVLAVKMLNKAEDSGDTLMHKREKLQKIPPELDAIFEQIIEKIDNDNLPETLRMMQCVLFADRLLTPEELCYLVAFGAEQEDDQISKLVTRDSQMGNFIRSRSGGLIEIKPHDRNTVVQFIHESVRDFLVQQKGFQRCFEELDPSIGALTIGRGYDNLTRSCLNYIKTKALHHGPHSNDPYNPGNIFLYFSANLVFSYAEKAEAEGISQDHLVEFLLRPTDHIFQFWKATQSPAKLWGIFSDADDNSPSLGWTLLHVASKHNLLSCVRILLEQGSNISEKDTLGRTALHIASQNGHKQMAQLLLRSGAKLDEHDNNGQSPLLLAAAHGHEALVLLFLNQDDVDPVSKNERGQAALIYAARGQVKYGYY